MAGGGTSIEEPTSRAWLVALVVTAPLAAFAVHQIGAPRTSWNYGAEGGAGRAIILLSVLSGLAAGGLVAAAVHRAKQERAWLGFVLGAIVIVVLGAMGAAQFADYMQGFVPLRLRQ